MSNNKQQTAVEWLIQKIYMSDFEIYNFMEENEDFEQAKEMEKQQMKLADENGRDRNQYKHDCEYGGVEYWDNEPKSFEQYYNETFKSE